MRLSGERLVAILVGLALTAMISVQIYWARRTFKEAEITFNDKIKNILLAVSKEATESSTCFTLYSKTYIDSGEGISMLKPKWKDPGVENWDHSKAADSIPMFFNIPEEYKNSSLNRVYYDLKFENPVTVEILLRFRYDMTGTSPEKEVLSRTPSIENFKELIRNHEDLLSIYDTLLIDSLIRLKLKNNNIPSPFSYALVRSGTDSIKYCSEIPQAVPLLASGIRAGLTPADLFSTPYDIVLLVKNKNSYILSSIVWVLGLSAGIILVLLFAYLYFIRAISRQKKLSEMKDDFINNITHELNTPITNIALAFETLKEKNKIADDAYAEKVSRIIQSETNNLKENVSRILRFSAFEKNGIQLMRESVELNSVINSALDRFELKLKQKNAVVVRNLSEQPVYYAGDRMHLTGTIENLIDNALKYCNGNCIIDITLRVDGENIKIRIKDNGIGISREEIERIFEKFYRVQHGNIQNERGFGLGLNYVKQIIDQHGGKINVNSNPGEGTCFEIVLDQNGKKN